MTNKKQEEQLNFIRIASELNQEMYERHGELEEHFFYTTDGYNDVFGFGDKILWDSMNDDRIYQEDINDYEPFKPYILRVFNLWIKEVSEYDL